jgi:hypothetical protein
VFETVAVIDPLQAYLSAFDGVERRADRSFFYYV